MAQFDINAFEQKYGVSSSAAPLNRNNLTTISAAKPSGNFSPANLAHSIAAVPSAVGKFVASALPNIPRLAQGITQGLPGIGSIAANQRNHAAAMKQIDAAEARYTKAFRDGKISKDRYKKLVKDLSNDRQKQTDTLATAAKGYVAPGDFAKDLVGTAALPFAFGRLTTAGTKGAATKAAQVLGGQATSRGATGVVKAGIEMQTAKGAAKSLALAPVKNTLINAPNAETAKQVVEGKNLGTNAAILAAPAVIGAAGKILPKVGKVIGDAVYGKAAGPIKSFFGEAKVTEAVKNNPKLAPVLKQAELFTKDQPGVKAGAKADQFFHDYLTNTLHLDPKKLSVEEFAQRFQRYAKPVEKLNTLKAAGKADARTVLTGKYQVGVPRAITRSGADIENLDLQGKVALAKQISSDLKVKNPRVADEIGNVIIQSNSMAEVKAGLKALDQYQELKVPGFKPPKGFMATYGPKDQAALTALKDVSGELDSGKKALPVIGLIGKALEKTGLSTQSQDPQVFEKFRSHLNDELQKSGMNAREVLNKLGDYAHQGRQGVGVFDERQLGDHALKQALQTTSSTQAKAVRKALLAAYDKMTWGELGAAGKIENALYKVPLYGQYRRIQGIGRYEMNPFFRLQSGVEAELLSQSAAKGKAVNLPLTNNIRQLFRSKSADELENIAKKVRGHLGEGYASVGAADNSFGILSAKLTRTQENSIGGLVKTMAEKSGQSVDDFLENADPKTLDSIRSVVQYPREGFTSSNFAKTLNLLVFPARYNVKLAQLAGKALADMPPFMQMGTLKAMSELSDWASSDEGIKWKKDNSELVGILNYLNPANNLGKIISGIKNNNLGLSDLGLIGGLPLGVITTSLQSQGINPGPGYQNPKTGAISPDKIPANMQGAVKMAITDLINSMYSFPGRTFGANLGKNDITGGIPGLKLNKGDTKSTTKPATPYQQKVQSVIGGAPKKAATPKPAPPNNVLHTAILSDSMKASVRAASAPKPKKVKTPRIKNKAVRPGQPF